MSPTTSMNSVFMTRWCHRPTSVLGRAVSGVSAHLSSPPRPRPVHVLSASHHSPLSRGSTVFRFVIEPRGVPGPRGAVFETSVGPSGQGGGDLYRIPGAAVATLTPLTGHETHVSSDAPGKAVAVTHPSPRRGSSAPTAISVAVCGSGSPTYLDGMPPSTADRLRFNVLPVSCSKPTSRRYTHGGTPILAGRLHRRHCPGAVQFGRAHLEPRFRNTAL